MYLLLDLDYFNSLDEKVQHYIYQVLLTSTSYNTNPPKKVITLTTTAQLSQLAKLLKSNITYDYKTNMFKLN